MSTSLKIERQNGNVVKALPGEDHITGFMAYLATGDIPAGFKSEHVQALSSIEAAEAAGIIDHTTGADGEETPAAWGLRVIHYHLSEIYRLNPGVSLYVGIFEKPTGSNMTFAEIKTVQNYAGSRIRQMAEAATKVVDIPYCIASGAGDGSYSWAASQGIPGLLLERGGNGECPPEQVECYCRDIHNLMVHLGLLKEELYPRQTARQVFEQTSYLAADCSGFWYPAVHIDQQISKGALLGEIKDVFGTVQQRYFAAHDGIVFYHAGGLIAKQGFTNLVAYGRI